MGTNYEYHRPYLDVQDAEQTIQALIKSDLKNQTYNVLSGNYTCREIISMIKETVPSLQVEMVTTPLLNQFSYLVDNTKLARDVVSLTGDIRQGINNTLDTLRCVKKY